MDIFVARRTTGLVKPASDVRTPYMVATITLTMVLLAAVSAFLGGSHLIFVAGVLFLALPAAAQISSSVVEMAAWLFGRSHPEPRRLPLWDASPAMAATVITYPVIVTDHHDVDMLLECMRDAQASCGPGFALHLALVDFVDSDVVRRDEDAALRADIEKGIASLNTASAVTPAGALFRDRRWSPGEGTYLGWERKRGKLEELMRLIAGQGDTTFVLTGTAAQDLVAALRGTRYVLTLDVGIRLQRRAAQRLVATIAHPDNHAVVDPSTGLVVRGFGFVRPTHVPPMPTTAFEWAWQPYLAPDGQQPPEQMAYGCDMFLGQGIIDVDTYLAVLAGRIPPDRVLSHDKLEGMHARCAAIAGARVAEAGTEDYLFFRSRQHRWIRGDVHLLPWVVASGRGTLRALPVADRWQMARDILHHLYPPSIVALLALGWIAAPHVGRWSAAVLVAYAYPVLMMPLMHLMGAARRHRPRRWLPRWLPLVSPQALRHAGGLLVVEAGRLVVWLPLLLDRALVALDAVVRAAYRTMVSRRHVLQWTSSAVAGRIRPGLVVRLRRLWPSCAAAFLLGVMVWTMRTDRLGWAAPLLALWLTAPVFAYWFARPIPLLTRRARGR